MTTSEHDVAFRALVLSGIWLILRAVALGRMPHGAPVWRGNAISHMDTIGKQGDEAHEHRRRETFPDWR